MLTVECLNASYNLTAAKHQKHIFQKYPVGSAEECADMIHDFVAIARALHRTFMTLKDHQLWTKTD